MSFPRRCESYGHAQPFSPSEELIEYIFQLTQGHSAALVCILEILAESSVSFLLFQPLLSFY